MCFDFGKWAENPSVSDHSIKCAQAVMNQLPNQQIGLVLMIGENDEQGGNMGEVFGLRDAEKVVSWAKEQPRIDWLSFWATHRDIKMWGRDPNINLGSTTRIKQEKYDFTKRFVQFQKSEHRPSYPPSPPSSCTHYVNSGDSCWKLHEIYGTSVDEIERLNNQKCSNNWPQIGQTVYVKNC